MKVGNLFIEYLRAVGKGTVSNGMHGKPPMEDIQALQITHVRLAGVENKVATFLVSIHMIRYRLRERQTSKRLLIQGG